MFTLVTAISAAALLTGCRTSSGEGRANTNRGESSETAAIAVTVAKTESRQVPAVIQATGSFVADETSNIAPKVAGKVSNVMVNVGQFVGSGSVIAKIDDIEPKLQLAEAQAAVKQRIAEVRQAEARLGLGPNGKFEASSIPEVRAAAANHEQALAELRQAEANEKRYRELVETGDTPMITYEQFRTTRDTARTRANAAKQQLDAAINTA
ncbi:MAG TPA: biotin/lipoyl-binding protein, partial [Pyrinomonadaceae bacterium]|nr:biotin/lipoyl-binding protein [Pyrinomonadaceae bacterium]